MTEPLEPHSGKAVPLRPSPLRRSPLRRARDWLDAADPGAIRRTQGARTVMAALATLLTLRALPAFGLDPAAGSVSYGVLAVFFCGMAIVDPLRRDRAITLGWAVGAFAAAALLAGLTEPIRFLPSILLLVLIALVFLARRAGRRASELAVLLAMGTYFADGGNVTLTTLPWFVAAATIGVAWFAVVLLVVLPYDPVRAIRGATRAYGARIADVVASAAAAVREPLADGSAPGTATESAAADVTAGSLARRLRLTKLTRRVMEAQLPGARAPGGWTADQVKRLQIALFEAELGATQLVDGCEDRLALAAMPVEIRLALAAALDAIAAALEDIGDPAVVETLAERVDDLRDQVMEAMVGRAAGGARPVEGADADASPVPWIAAGLRIANGGRRVARAIATARRLQAATIAAEQTDQARTSADRPPAPGQGAGPSPRRPATPWSRSRPPGGTEVLLGPLTVHLTTALAIQAVLATGLSMAVAWLFGAEHPNWVFWTSFVVIAGSLDESLNRMLNRIAGTIGGVVIGVLLATLLPDELAWVAVVAIVSIYLAIYMAPVSHAWFVFWLNVAFAIVYAGKGDPLELLVQRPLMTVVGAGISAIIVTRVLPVRTSGRYTATLAGFLAAVREAVTVWTAAPAAGDVAPGPLAAVDAAYRQVEAASVTRHSGLRFMDNDRAEQREETEVAALAVAVGRLATAVELQPDAARRDPAAAAGARVARNLDAVISLAGGTPSTLVPRLDDLLVTAGPRAAPPVPPAATQSAAIHDAGPEQSWAGVGRPTGGAVLAAMVDLHTCVVRLGAALAAGLPSQRPRVLAPSSWRKTKE